jgi:hypothetical protein
MSLARKFQIPDGQGVCVINPPARFQIDAPVTTDAQGAVLLFAADSKTLMKLGKPVFAAAKANRLAWIAYPKAGQLGTDLNRDILWKKLESIGIRAVRQISIDDTWSAMRFRPQSHCQERGTRLLL